MADANIIVKIVDQTRGGMSSVTKQVDTLGSSANNAQKGFGGLGKAIGALAAAVSVKAFIEFGDQIQNINNRIALINPELGSAAENFAAIAAIAQTTFQPLENVAGLYQKVAQAADTYNLSAQEVGTVTETFTNLLRLAGADAGTAAGAITQFAQALGSGTLRGDELNSVIEATAGEILPVLARELGVSRGEVRGLAQDGQITGDILLNALAASADETSARVNQMGVTIGGAITYFKNELLTLGQEGTPVFDAIAQAIMFVADNLDIVVTAAAAFFTVFAVKKIVDIVTGIAALTRGIIALNLTMATNPIGLALLAISGTIVLLYTQWDNLKAIAVSALDAIVVAGLTLQKWFYEFLDIIVNGVPNAFMDMGKRAANVMSALVAAAKDPFNAFEAFRDELKRGNLQLEDNRITVIDFSGKIEDLDRRIGDVSSSTDENTKLMGENADGTVELGDTKEDLTSTAEENSEAMDENSDSLARNEQEARLAERAAANLRAAIERGTTAVNASIKAYDNETYAMGLGEDKKTDLMRLIDEEQALRRAAGDEIGELTEEQIRQILELSDVNAAAALDFINLTDDQIAAIGRQTEARREATATRTRLAEQEREQARQTEEFTRDTERAIQRHYEDTTIKSQQLTDELEEYVQRARQQGKENDADVQDAIRAYRSEINKEITNEYQDMIDDQVSAQNEFKSKFSGIYDDIFDKISDWTGKSKGELEKYSQYAELFLGVNPMNSLTNMLTNGLMGINNFATGGANQIGNFAGQTMGYMDATGKFIATNTFGANGQAAGGIAGFVGYALQALGGGGGLFGVVTALFGGLGLNLKGIFSNVFSWIGDGLSGVGGFLGDIWGGIKSFGSSVFGGVGDFFGGLVSGVSNFFSGLFADGGYIKPGTVGIVGEAGPEFVSGPANVTSARDTASMMGGASGVNITFNIQAVDAKGIDQLLIERKSLIADVVRDAVSSSGRRI